jgi:hypothetical protein
MSATRPPAAPPATADPADKPPSPSGERGPRQPEKKIGPFAGGVGVAVWLNQTETSDGGPRMFRSITVAPRRYFDKESNQWKDAPSYNPTDLPALIFALQEAQAYCFTTPLPGGAEHNGEEVPF